MGAPDRSAERTSSQTPIWDAEFAARWQALQTVHHQSDETDTTRPGVPQPRRPDDTHPAHV